MICHRISWIPTLSSCLINSNVKDSYFGLISNVLFRPLSTIALEIVLDNNAILALYDKLV